MCKVHSRLTGTEVAADIRVTASDKQHSQAETEGADDLGTLVSIVPRPRNFAAKRAHASRVSLSAARTVFQADVLPCHGHAVVAYLECDVAQARCSLIASGREHLKDGAIYVCDRHGVLCVLRCCSCIVQLLSPCVVCPLQARGVGFEARLNAKIILDLRAKCQPTRQTPVSNLTSYESVGNSRHPISHHILRATHTIHTCLLHGTAKRSSHFVGTLTGGGSESCAKQFEYVLWQQPASPSRHEHVKPP
jgi:hypothetical protein